MSGTVVEALCTTCVVTGDQSKLQLCFPIIVETDVPGSLCQLSRHRSSIRAVSSALTMNVLHPVVFCHTWVLQTPSKDCKGPASLYECDVELLNSSPADWNFSQPELVRTKKRLDPLICHQGDWSFILCCPSPVVFTAGLFLLGVGHTVAGVVMQTTGVYHRVGQGGQLLRNWIPHSCDNMGLE